MEEKVLTEEEKKKRREERRKRKKYRLLILLLLLCGTGIMLATSTYAWFTSNLNVGVSNLQVSIETKNGIQISTDAKNWKAIVTEDDIKNAHTVYTNSVNQLPESLEPVSTVGNVTEGKMDMYYGVVGIDESTGNQILTATKETERDDSTPEVDPAKFISFDLFFKVNDETDIWLMNGSGVTQSAGVGIKNAARISYLDLGNKPDGTPLGEVQGITGGTTPIIWEPNANTHSSTGITNATNLHDESGVNATEPAKIVYYGVKTPITADNKVVLKDAVKGTASTYVSQVSPRFSTAEGELPTEVFAHLAKGISKVRIYMWVEGQDVDCENNASGGTIDFILKFTTVDPSTVTP